LGKTVITLSAIILRSGSRRQASLRPCWKLDERLRCKGADQEPAADLRALLKTGQNG